MKELNKILVVLGPTAAGKTSLSIELAKKYNGEIINADSRQIYKEMQVGTEKPSGIWQKFDGHNVYMVEDIRHHLMDVVEPSSDFSLSEYKKMAIEAIDAILKRGKLPILVGGTGQYIWAIVDNLDIPPVAPSIALRQEFENEKLEDLVKRLKEIDPKAIEQIDLKNPRRVIRALEVAIVTGKSFTELSKKSDPLYNALQIGVKIDRDILNERINNRVDEQIKNGLIDEVKKLKDKYGLGLDKFYSISSIGYREILSFLKGEIGLEKAIELIKKNTRNYAKRQMTWFKRDQRIKWIESFSEADEEVKKFL